MTREFMSRGGRLENFLQGTAGIPFMLNTKAEVTFGLNQMMWPLEAE